MEIISRNISCIIPAYNEEKTIAHTLQAVCAAGASVSEIIVVDDGSKDATRELVHNFPKVRLLANEKNCGKSASIARGIKEATGDYILMLDADLLGLEVTHITGLIQPIKEGLVEAVISMRENTPSWMKLLGFDSMSGERVLPKGLFMEYIDTIETLRNFGLEVFLNRLIIAKKIHFMTVRMTNVKNQLKWEKRPFWQGVWGELKMWLDLFKTVSLFEFIRQHILLKKLLIKN